MFPLQIGLREPSKLLTDEMYPYLPMQSLTVYPESYSIEYYSGIQSFV